MIKSSFRKSILRRRLALSKSIVSSLSERIQTTLIESEYFQKAKSIAIYSPIKNEVKTDLIIENSISKNKDVFLPRIDKKHLSFISFLPESKLTENKFSIPEVANPKASLANQFDLIICPGVCFDGKKNRIGYGGGYYDRFLSLASYNHLGMIAFDMQRIEIIEPEEHDVPMEFIITESGFLN